MWCVVPLQKKCPITFRKWGKDRLVCWYFNSGRTFVTYLIKAEFWAKVSPLIKDEDVTSRGDTFSIASD
jgi:hypothetical protein